MCQQLPVDFFDAKIIEEKSKEKLLRQITTNKTVLECTSAQNTHILVLLAKGRKD